MRLFVPSNVHKQLHRFVPTSTFTMRVHTWAVNWRRLCPYQRAKCMITCFFVQYIGVTNILRMLFRDQKEGIKCRVPSAPGWPVESSFARAESDGTAGKPPATAQIGTTWVHLNARSLESWSGTLNFFNEVADKTSGNFVRLKKIEKFGERHVLHKILIFF